jgi:hypothetical protein
MICLKKLQILPFYSQYIYSLLIFEVKNRDLFKLNSDIQYTIMISIWPQHNQSYFKKKFFIQELQHTITFHWLSRSCNMMSNNLDEPWKDLFSQNPFILSKSILTLTGNEWHSVCCKSYFDLHKMICGVEHFRFCSFIF